MKHVGGLLFGIDDNWVDVVAGCDVDAEDVWDDAIVDEIEVERFEVVEDVVETENCAWACAFAYFGGSLAVTYTVYWPCDASARRVNWSWYAPV
jgi:hypothetical protein